jgi:hypothetical protein
LQRQNDPDALTDCRTPTLDLDNLYGRGPADQPYRCSICDRTHDVVGLPNFVGAKASCKPHRYGTAGIQGFINIEGNLAPEDCMFSRRVTSHTFDELSGNLFRQIQSRLCASKYPGDHMIAHNMALNTDIRAYFQYSFETVRESDSGRLLDEFLSMPVPRLFLFGDANRSLSYIPKLRVSNVEVCEVPQSAHFLFYDNPVETFIQVRRFVTKYNGSSL